MSAITIDHQVSSQTCEHCHREFEVSRGAAYDNGKGFSIYLAGMHKCGSGSLVHLAIAIREGYKMSHETSAIALQVWATASDFEMQVVDARNSPWRDQSYLGRMMDREEALNSPQKELFFHIADHIVADNPKVQEYLNGTSM